MKVLVPRSLQDAERTAGRLAALGHEAVLAPVTEIVPTGDPVPTGAYDSIIVTSAHAVEALAPVADRHVPAFAVGERTAQAMREAGLPAPAVAQGDAVSLSRLIRDSLRPGLTLLHATARHHKDEPAASLRAAGFRVLQWEAYEARAAEGLPPRVLEALRTGRIDAALHYSRRSATLFIRLIEEAGLTATLRNFPHLCLSADVAAPMAAAGLSTLEAEEPSEDGLLALLGRLP